MVVESLLLWGLVDDVVDDLSSVHNKLLVVVLCYQCPLNATAAGRWRREFWLIVVIEAPLMVDIISR